MRALCVFLAVAVPSMSFAYGPADDDRPVRQTPSQRLLPQPAPSQGPLAAGDAPQRPPFYQHWAFYLGMGVLTAALIGVALGVWIGSTLRPPVPVQSAPSINGPTG